MLQKNLVNFIFFVGIFAIALWPFLPTQAAIYRLKRQTGMIYVCFL